VGGIAQHILAAVAAVVVIGVVEGQEDTVELVVLLL
jgi:hypothetical protein